MIVVLLCMFMIYEGVCLCLCTLSLKFSYAFFFFKFVFVILSYQNACYGWENAENRTRSVFLWQTKVSEAVCKRDWHNVRSYLFFNLLKFRTQCTMAFSSQWGQKKIINAGNLFRTRDCFPKSCSKLLF